MAYSIYDQTNYTRFQPMSYEQLVSPVMLTQQYHDNLNEQIYKLSSEANAVGNMASEQSDPISYQRYKSYSDQLQQASNALANEGITPNSMRDALKLRSEYTNQIMPIQQAITSRQEAYKRYVDAYQKDPTTVTNLNPATVSLDEYIQNKNAYDFKSLSGEKITKQVQEMAKGFSEKFRNDPNFRKSADGQYFETVLQRGFSPQDIANYISGSDKNPYLAQIIGTALEASGISTWNIDSNPQALSRVIQYANQGLYSAIGKDEFHDRANKDYMNPLDWARYRKLIGEQSAISGPTFSAYESIEYDIPALKGIKNSKDLFDRIKFDEKGNYVESYSEGLTGVSPMGLTTQYGRVKANPEMDKQLKKYAADKTLGDTPRERIQNGFERDINKSARLAKTYTFNTTDNSNIDNTVATGIRMNQGTIKKVENNNNVSKVLDKKDALKIAAGIQKGEYEYALQAGVLGQKSGAEGLDLINKETGERYRVSWSMFPSDIRPQLEAWHNSAITNNQAGTESSYKQVFNDMGSIMNTITQQANTKVPQQSKTSNTYWDK